jgi:superfamily II DNA or RNA helicase
MPNNFTFTEAKKGKEFLRLALDGPTGGGKTWTALEIASRIAERMGEPGHTALIDSERSSSLKYAPYFKFRQLTLPNFDPNTYIAALEAAIDQGFPVIIIDSLSHAWEGTLDLKDKVTRRSRSTPGER